ncbi:MAG: hypothetical protein LC117_06945 [Bacteroidia bacterium]|nr:hypothetical protein [Bacteroidia bacterium]MCZ2277647.1 hypothetical protein [Bacteroidia bacterium]
MKYTPQFLAKLEDMIKENNYILRKEKGNFKSGYCLFKDNRIIVINKFASLESRVNSLIEILKELNEKEQLSDNAREELLRIETFENKKARGLKQEQIGG